MNPFDKAPSSPPHEGRSSPSHLPLFGVDTMVFIYHFEQNAQHGASAGLLLEAAESGHCRLVCSIIAMMEVLVVPRRHGAESICRRYRDFFQLFPNLHIIPVDQAIAELASDLRAANPNLRTPDALHLASALHLRADAYVTNDQRVPAIPGLPVLPLDRARGML